MSNTNSILAYLNHVCETKYDTKHSVFSPYLSFSPADRKGVSQNDGSSPEQFELSLKSLSMDEVGIQEDLEELTEGRDSFGICYSPIPFHLERQQSEGSFSEYLKENDRLPECQHLPIHELLLLIQRYAEAPNNLTIENTEVNDDQSSEDTEIKDSQASANTEVKDSQVLIDHANFFTPIVLHHWELSRLAEIVRCRIKQSLAFRIYQLSIEKKELSKIQNKSIEANLQHKEEEHKNLNKDLQQRKKSIEKLQKSIDDGKRSMIKGEAASQTSLKEDLQAALVLSYLLNITYRRCMSAPWLSDQFKFEDHMAEYRTLLENNHQITFDDERFSSIFEKHPSRIKPTKTWEDWLKEAKGPWHSSWGNTEEVRKKWDIWLVSRIRDAQAISRDFNHWRLGGLRLRRLGVFLLPVLQNEHYSLSFNLIDQYVRWFYSYCNVIFFMPRFGANLTLLGHHVLNDSELDPLERSLDRMTRFRAHWSRFWFEVISDSYWLINGILLFAVITGGPLSTAGICLGLLIQVLDFVCAIMRERVELNRYYGMLDDLKKLDTPMSLEKQLELRTSFESWVLKYNMFHFGMLLLGLCLTLPAMAAISTMWPVVGGVCAFLLTGVTYYVSNQNIKHRQTEFENRAPLVVVSDEVTRLPSSTSRYMLG